MMCAPTGNIPDVPATAPHARDKGMQAGRDTASDMSRIVNGFETAVSALRERAEAAEKRADAAEATAAAERERAESERARADRARGCCGPCPGGEGGGRG